jgi:hypothetical protein
MQNKELKLLNKIKRVIDALVDDKVPVKNDIEKHKQDVTLRDEIIDEETQKQIEYNNMVTNNIRDYQNKLIENYEIQMNAREEVLRMKIENERIAEAKRFFKEKMLLIC